MCNISNNIYYIYQIINIIFFLYVSNALSTGFNTVLCMQLSILKAEVLYVYLKIYHDFSVPWDNFADNRSKSKSKQWQALFYTIGILRHLSLNWTYFASSLIWFLNRDKILFECWNHNATLRPSIHHLRGTFVAVSQTNTLLYVNVISLETYFVELLWYWNVLFVCTWMSY